MGKGDQRGKAPLPKLANAPRKERSGRIQRPTTTARRQEANQEAMMQTLKTRCRHNGLTETPENIARVKSQNFEGQVGILLHKAANDELADDLWRTFSEWDATEERYFRRILGKPRHAKAAKIEMMPEPMETRDDDSADTRTPDERDRAAVNAWTHWRGQLGKLHAKERQHLHDGALGRVRLVVDGRATIRGMAFYNALVRLHEVKD